MRTEAALKKNKSNRSSKPYKQAESVGVIFSVEDKQKHQDIKEFILQLERDGKKVTVFDLSIQESLDLPKQQSLGI